MVCLLRQIVLCRSHLQLPELAYVRLLHFEVVACRVVHRWRVVEMPCEAMHLWSPIFHHAGLMLYGPF